MPQIETVIVVLLALAAAAFDLRTRRIPNALTLPCIAVGLVLAGVQGWREVAVRGLTALVLLVAALFLFSAGVLGGGDGKLAVAIAALKGPAFTGGALLYAVLLGGLVALVVLVRKRTLRPSLIKALKTAVGLPHEDTVGEQTYIPIAPVMGGGVVATALLGHAQWSRILFRS